MKKITCAFLGLVLAATFSAGSLAPAQADTETIPPDVLDAFSAEALVALQKADESLVTVDETGAPDFAAATSFGKPRQVNLWSTNLILGESSAEPTALLEEWVAPIVGSEGKVIGTYRVWRATPDSRAELAGYNDDVELAGALQNLAGGSVLVSDPTVSAWYELRDGSVTALNQSASREVPYPAPLAEVAHVVSTRYAAAIKSSEETGEGAAGGAGVQDRRPWFYGMDLWILGAGTLTLLVSFVCAIWWVRARRRTTPTA